MSQHLDHPPQACHQQGVRTEHHGNQILRVHGDSDSDLEALFSVLRNIDTGKVPTSSYKNRKLPASFFCPPDPKACGVNGHGRSVSSPAKLHQTMPAAPGSQQGHGKQASALDPLTAVEGGFGGGGHGGWCDATKNCPRYYVNSTVGVWSSQQQSTQPHQDLSMSHTQGNGVYTGRVNPHQMSPEFLHHDLGPLPHGWEQGITPDGEIYFINHIDKTTSWYDPRIPRSRQTSTPMRVGHSGGMGAGHLGHVSPKHHSQQQQQHLLAVASLQQQQQMLQQQLAARNTPNEHFICLELQKLHREKERLQQEQEAITCREMMLNELVRHSAVTSPPCLDGQLKCGQLSLDSQLTMLHGPLQSLYPTPGQQVDPFVGSVSTSSGLVESHARQNSADSGLGGMGTAYSLPRSPDDYLSNVDEMDAQEDGCQLAKPVNSCYAINNNDVTGGHMRMTSVSDAIDGGGVMDSEQLVSSLAGEFSSDLLGDMDVQKIDNLLWL